MRGYCRAFPILRENMVEIHYKATETFVFSFTLNKCLKNDLHRFYTDSDPSELDP